MKKYYSIFLVSVFSLFMLTGCETLEEWGDEAEDETDEMEDTF